MKGGVCRGEGAFSPKRGGIHTGKGGGRERGQHDGQSK